MYDLMGKYSGAIMMAEKENCPFARRRPHWQFFNSLPEMKLVTENKLVIDGCIDVAANIKMRGFLHEPKTLYIVSYNKIMNVRFDKCR